MYISKQLGIANWGAKNFQTFYRFYIHTYVYTIEYRQGVTSFLTVESYWRDVGVGIKAVKRVPPVLIEKHS
jgi:hypothetical protein